MAEQTDIVIPQGANLNILHEREDFSSSLIAGTSAEMRLREGIGGDLVLTLSTANGKIVKAAHGSHIDFTVYISPEDTSSLDAPSSGVYDIDITVVDGGVTTVYRHAEGSYYITPNI